MELSPRRISVVIPKRFARVLGLKPEKSSNIHVDSQFGCHRPAEKKKKKNQRRTAHAKGMQ